MKKADSPEAPVRAAPRSARGARTRAALVAAARTVFVRDGYVNARMSDITRKANNKAEAPSDARGDAPGWAARRSYRPPGTTDGSI